MLYLLVKQRYYRPGSCVKEFNTRFAQQARCFLRNQQFEPKMFLMFLKFHLSQPYTGYLEKKYPK